MNKLIGYQVVWDNGNGHACGVFPEIHETEEAARKAGEFWVAEMETIDPDGEGEYTFDVQEVIKSEESLARNN